MVKFTHLHTHSHYSLLDGLAKIDDLIERAKELGMDSLALTDHGNLYGSIEFYKKATKAGIKPILGMEAYVALGSRHDRQLNKTQNNNPDDESMNSGGRQKENYHHLTLLCENEEGWKNLIKLSSKSHLEGFYYKPRVDKEILREHAKGLIALSGCVGAEIPQLILNNQLQKAEDTIKEYQDIFGKENFFLEVGFHPNIDVVGKANEGVIAFAKKLNIPLVATQDIHYARPEDAEYQDILLAVQTGNKITDEGRLSMKIDDFSLKPGEEIAEAFKDLPEVVTNTQKIADRCNVKIELGKSRLPKFLLPENETPNSYLEKLVNERILKRYPRVAESRRFGQGNATKEELDSDARAVIERLDYEMDVIKKTGFADYFLIVQDFITWAKNHGIVVGPGRGSAAGSMISYVLGITDIDPLKYDSLFERFLNPDRIQMPDIDIDFTDIRRDEVLSYIKQKYGEDKVAQIITFGTMAARAAIRDAGRAFGMPYSFCDQISKLIPAQMDLKEALKEVAELRQMYNATPDAKKLIDAAKHLEGVVRHASVHACGVVIAPDSLTDFLPLQRAPQNDTLVITQIEMHGVEDLGLLKMDFLGLKNLTIIEETLRLIRENKNENIKISEIPLEDEKTFELLRRGDTTGVFQLESAGIRRYLKELKPTEFEDVIAMVALYRPGPMELIPQYIKRKHKEEEVKYIHQMLEPILKNTYGIGVYQEQMMRIARDLAGFTLAEADTLRKAIGKKIKELLDAQKEKLISGMIKNGIADKTANKIWELFPPFAKYGFNRSHAACYAMIAYQTAYLKAHYPIEFTTALFNADSGDTERAAFLISEVKKNNIKVFAPDVNKSFVNFTPEESSVDENNNFTGGAIRFGLLAIKNVGENVVTEIIAERQRGGSFDSIENFIERVKHKDVNKKSMESMIKAGVFDSFNCDRGQLLANIDELLRYSQSMRKDQTVSQNNLFGNDFNKTKLNLKPAEPATKKDKLMWEKELLGVYISDHPLNAYKKKLEELNVKSIKNILSIVPDSKESGVNHRIAGVLAGIKKIITKKGQPMIFARIEDFNDGIELIVFSDTMAKKPALWQENNLLIAEGKVNYRDGDAKFVCAGAIELI